MNHIQELAAAGQSVWLDYIERSMVQSGALAGLVAEGVTGVTSNPTIFQQAITKSQAYAADLQRLVTDGHDANTIFETLAIADIQAAADVLRPVYDAAGGHDGFVSLEVTPDLAYDTDKTVAQAQRLHAAVSRANLLIKVPATKPGIPAIRQLIADGISVNVTLIFSQERYKEVMEAYIQGLEARAANGQPVDRIASVASFFVSRVDTNVDARLEQIAASDSAQAKDAAALLGKAAIANAKLAYREFAATFAGPRWHRLRALGARVQRPLWASTSSKNPAYPDLIYVEPLIGPHTVNTMPPKTLDAVRDHCVIVASVERDVDAAAAQLQAIEALGIAMNAVTEELEIDGVKKFSDSFVDLVGAIDKRRRELLASAAAT